MTLPTMEQLTTALRAYVSVPETDTAALTYIRECVAQAVSFITRLVPNTTGAQVIDGYVTPNVETSPLGDELFKREVMELGTELFYRRQAKNGIVSVNAMDGMPIRVSNDPYKASEQRLARFMPLGFS